jgi:DNA-directed RNA polymerase specialized sigma subunit
MARNIFDRVVGTLPKPDQKYKDALEELSTPKDLSKEPLSKLSDEELVSVWTKENTPAQTSELLKRLGPTMDSAIRSYAGGSPNMRISAANMALDACRSYDPGKGAKLSTHVFSNLMGLNRLSTKRSTVAPQVMYNRQLYNAMTKAMGDYEDEHGVEPPLQYLSDTLGVPVKKVIQLQDEGPGGEISMSQQVGEEDEKDTFATSDVTDEDYLRYLYADYKDDPTSQKIIEWGTNMTGRKPLSNGEIARRLKISDAAVSQRKKKIQRRMEELRGLI